MPTKKTTKPYGLGRRKTAVAQVILLTDSKDKLVNKKPITEYFSTTAQQNDALQSLTITSQMDEYGFKAKVYGGGKPSQAGAIKLAIARALVSIDEGFHKQLKDEGLLTRDPRMKERKKFGLKGARRAPQFSKR